VIILQKKETLINEFKTYVGAYYGVNSMDEYDLKVYVLKEIEQDIKDFILVNDLDKNECLLLAKEVEEKVPLKTKLQDSLLILYKMNASMELIFMIKNKLKKYNK
jgi:hypothetical protein